MVTDRVRCFTGRSSAAPTAAYSGTHRGFPTRLRLWRGAALRVVPCIATIPRVLISPSTRWPVSTEPRDSSMCCVDRCGTHHPALVSGISICPRPPSGVLIGAGRLADRVYDRSKERPGARHRDCRNCGQPSRSPDIPLRHARSRPLSPDLGDSSALVMHGARRGSASVRRAARRLTSYSHASCPQPRSSI
jgi:hypothetical protein